MPAVVGLLAACSRADEGTSSSGSGPASTATEVRLGYFPNITHAPALIGVSQNLVAPEPLRVGSNGTVYFAEGNLTLGGNKIGAYDPRRRTPAEYPTPTPEP